MEKQVAKMIQTKTQLFHPLQYGSRSRHSIIDSLMLILSEVERAIKSGLQVTLLGGDIVSAFKQVKKEVVVSILKEHQMEKIADFVQHFLRPRQFKVQ